MFVLLLEVVPVFLPVLFLVPFVHLPLWVLFCFLLVSFGIIVVLPPVLLVLSVGHFQLFFRFLPVLFPAFACRNCLLSTVVLLLPILFLFRRFLGRLKFTVNIKIG